MKTKQVIVLPYDAQWKRDFETICEELKAALGELVVSIEHVGSTSVEGLSAKPVIDIDVVIGSMDEFAEVSRRLKAIGYLHEGNLGIEGWEAFGYRGKEHLRTHHLYVCPENSEELKRHIALRDYLRKNPDAVKEYGRIKTEGARLYPQDIEGYIRHKGAFIEKAYRETGVSRNVVCEMAEWELDEAASFSWRLCADEEHRSYPYMESEAEIRTEFEKRMKSADGGAMVCRAEGELKGAACWFSIEEERYLQTTGLYAESAAVIETMLAEIEKKYPDYERYIGVTKENDDAAQVLGMREYALVDDCIDYRRGRSNRLKEESDTIIVRIDDRWKEEYLAFHERNFDDGYWNSRRLEEHFEEWDIYAVIEESQVRAGLFAKDYGNGTGEIFGIQAIDMETACELMRYAVDDIQERHAAIKEMVFMAEAKDENAGEAAGRAGFRRKSTYRCWKK